MKVLNLRFKNLNSLAGEWSIDLTHPAFTTNGIFAIIGPTGAGKSTILDALCLALYGRTPRLNKVTKGANEIMSRQTGECFAEVIFETQNGRYRCHWSQHRARKKASGELQSPKHELADADSGAILETRISNVAKKIEAVTGMDFDRFTRSMLLAQSGFAAFLQATADERAPILEQITGTEIYSQISIRVHACLREQREKLERLQAETAGIEILEPAQEVALAETLQARQKEETELSAQCAGIGKAIAWLTSLEEMKKDIANLADEAATLQNELEAFKPERETLNRALKAATLDGDYATFTASRKQQTQDKNALKNEQAMLPELEKSVQARAEILKTAELTTEQANLARQTAMPTLHAIRAIDQTLAEQQKAIIHAEQDCCNAASRIESDSKTRLVMQKKRATVLENQQHIEAYLKTHAQDEWLVTHLTGIEQQLNNLLSIQTSLEQLAAEQSAAIQTLKKLKRAHDNSLNQATLCQNELKTATEQLEHGKQVLNRLLDGRLLREYRNEKESLLREMAYLARIAELEDHRAKLEDGKPCPLCGATDHPYARGNVPVADEIEHKIATLEQLIKKAETQEAAIKTLEQVEKQARDKSMLAETHATTAAHDKKTAEKNLADITASLEKRRAEFSGHRQAVLEKLQPLGICEISETDISALLNALRTRLNNWQTQNNKKVEIEMQLVELDSELKRLDAVIDTQNTILTEKRAHLDALKKQYASESETRKTLYGDTNPDAEEQRLNKAVSEAEAAVKQAREQYNKTQQHWQGAKTRAESLKKSIHQRAQELSRMEQAFTAALANTGFADESQFLQARRPVEQREALADKAKALDACQTELKARKADRESRLATEMARKITNKSLDELEPQIRSSEASLKELQDSIAGIKHQLQQNTVAKERIKEKHAIIEAQTTECQRWQNMHELIGSADGKKYRNFAQGLTFEMMIGHANRQLQKMTERYLLIRDSEQPLELNVVDNYQAGEIRSTKNLSGGESFIVSLALALGLSNMASHNVRVDSLFLDEGFGTLDEEALDTALETLSSLQQDGKLIGIISHVSTLKERISTQIEVTPQTGGRSFIAGPGSGRVHATE